MSATSLPSCIQSGAAAIAAEVGCGQATACCNSEAYLALLQPMIFISCPDSAAALSQAQSFCTAANPHLHDSRGPQIIAPVTIFLALAIIAVILRFYARHISKTPLGWDDWLAVASLVFNVVTSSLELWGLDNGAGKHQFMVPLNEIQWNWKASIASQWIAVISIMLLKSSILALYLRVFGHVRKLCVAVYVVLAATIIQSITLSLSFTLSCKPIAFLWDKTIPGGHCLSVLNFIIGWAASDLATGLAVLVLPIPLLWKMQMNWPKKLAIAVVFVLGGFTCVAGLIRIPFILELDVLDVSWSIVPLTVFGCIEIDVGIISICLPAMRPLFGTFFDKSYFSRQSGSGSKKSGSNKHHSRIPETPNIYTGSTKGHNQSGSGAWAISDNHQGVKATTALDRESDDETWPMKAIGIKNEVDVERDGSLGRGEVGEHRGL